jgi:hypothetical protein
MNPDQEHKKYFQENPTGTHFIPSQETLRFMDRQEKTNQSLIKGMESINVKLTGMSEKMDAIHEQVKKTNGRVTKNEEFRTNNDEFIVSLKQKHNYNSSKIIDYAWKIGFLIFALLVGLANLDNFANFIK